MLTEGAKAVAVFASELGVLSAEELATLRRMVELVKWREVTGRGYDTADAEYWEPCKRSFFIRMRAGGDVPRHHDAFIAGPTHHLVVATGVADARLINCRSAPKEGISPLKEDESTDASAKPARCAHV